MSVVGEIVSALAIWEAIKVSMAVWATVSASDSVIAIHRWAISPVWEGILETIRTVWVEVSILA